MNSTEIRAAYDSGDTALIDWEACQVMGNHHDIQTESQSCTCCKFCGTGLGNMGRPCTRYTTDLTSAAELEAKCKTRTASRMIYGPGRVELYSKIVLSDEDALGCTFGSDNEALNRTTAALYARAWEAENQ